MDEFAVCSVQRLIRYFFDLSARYFLGCFPILANTVVTDWFQFDLHTEENVSSKDPPSTTNDCESQFAIIYDIHIFGSVWILNANNSYNTNTRKKSEIERMKCFKLASSQT